MSEAVAADPEAKPKSGNGGGPGINPETHDPVTGKPWKELAKEHERKALEAQGEVSKLRARPAGDQPPGGGQPEGRFKTAEEYKKYLEDRFADDPVGAMLEIASTAAHVNIRRTREDIAMAARLLKQVKRDLKARYEDFAEHEEEFDTRLEDQPVELMTKEGLEMVFHAVRGERLDAKLRELQKKADAKPKEEPAKKIVGPVSSGAGGSPAAPGGKKPLTDTQQAELAKMGDVSEDGYRRLIEQRRERARKLGIPEAQLPETLGETLRRPQQQ